MSNVVNKNQHLTKEQKDILINFVQEHEDIQCGKFTATFTHKKMQVLWEQVTATLNSVPQGAIKDWRQWRKVISCFKISPKNVKYQFLNIFRHGKT